MSLSSKILAVFVFLAACGFLVLAARTLKTHQNWREAAGALEQQIQTAQAEIERTREGDPQAERDAAQASLRQVSNMIDALVNDRGRVWEECEHNVTDPNTGAVSVRVGFPQNHQIQGGMILFVFEADDVENGGKYLGEFRVAEDPADPEAELSLVPVRLLEGNALQNVVRSNALWTLYEVMPLDSHQVFAGLNEAEIDALLPEAMTDEYLKDQKPVGAGDDVDEENIHVRVRFRRPFKLTLEEPGADGQVQTRVRQFEEGDEFLLSAAPPPPGADPARFPQVADLESQGIVEVVERIYVRTLRDYAALFSEHQRLMVVGQSLLAAARNDLKSIEEAQRLAEAQAQALQDEIARQQQEQQKLQQELELAQQHRDTLLARLKNGQAALNRLREENQQLAEKLRTLQQQALNRAVQASAEVVIDQRP